ncbi:MAG: AAA family ATPase, partial [Gammaproteobacteria bacterium]|nr:AAA family ATPase [Gammaproteobacteria bacterium]
MYKEFYQFDFLPFNMSPDPRFYFNSKGHNKAYSYMQYGLSQGEGFIVVTGDIGTGKTTIVKHLIDELDLNTFIVKQLVTTYIDGSDLLEMVCESFDIASEGMTKAARINKLDQYLKYAYQKNKRVILIIDEVQNLPMKTVEELRMLSNFQLDNKPLIQSFLVGQKEFIPTLKSNSLEQLRQRVIASCHLGPLNAEETKEYIQYRISTAGRAQDDLFDNETYYLIHEFTEGVPRRINVFCDRILLFGYLEEINWFTIEHINQVADELDNELTTPVTRKNLNGDKDDTSEPFLNTINNNLDTSNEIISDVPDRTNNDLGKQLTLETIENQPEQEPGSVFDSFDEYPATEQVNTKTEDKQIIDKKTLEETTGINKANNSSANVPNDVSSRAKINRNIFTQKEIKTTWENKIHDIKKNSVSPGSGNSDSENSKGVQKFANNEHSSISDDHHQQKQSSLAPEPGENRSNDLNNE